MNGTVVIQDLEHPLLLSIENKEMVKLFLSYGADGSEFIRRYETSCKIPLEIYRLLQKEKQS